MYLKGIVFYSYFIFHYTFVLSFLLLKNSFCPFFFLASFFFFLFFLFILIISDFLFFFNSVFLCRLSHLFYSFFLSYFSIRDSYNTTPPSSVLTFFFTFTFQLLTASPFPFPHAARSMPGNYNECIPEIITDDLDMFRGHTWEGEGF